MISMHADNSAYICTIHAHVHVRVALKHIIRICTKPKVFDFRVSKPDNETDIYSRHFNSHNPNQIRFQVFK